jgi:hypothetical protein
VIAESNADVLVLQEVFDQASLDFFHDRFLAPLDAVYPHRRCLEGNDGRSEDIAVLSRAPLQRIASHAAMTYDDIGFSPPREETGGSRIFRRDCLAVLCNSLWIYGCHFKLAEPGSARDRTVRRAEALAVRRIIEREFADAAEAQWLALGDFNIHDGDDAADVEALLAPFSVDLTRDMPEAERWTCFDRERGAKSCPDRLLCSPALKRQRIENPPVAIRSGLPGADSDDGATLRRPRASDHALLWVDVD